MSTPDESIQEQFRAERIRSVEHRTLVGARVQFVGIDAPPATLATDEEALGVAALQAWPPATPSFMSPSSTAGKFEKDDRDEQDERDVAPAIEDRLTPMDRAWVARTAALIRDNVLRDAGSQAAVIADAVVAKLHATGMIVPSAPTTTEPERILISSAEAARLLGISRAALAKRVERHQVPGVCRIGSKVQFNREKLIAGINKRTRA